MVNKELMDALEKDINELYLELGKEIFSIEKQALPVPIKRYIETAKEWMKKNKDQLKRKICLDKNIAEYLLNNGRSKDRVMLASAILDLLASITIGVSPVIVTALIVNEGIKTFCSKE